MILKVEIEIDDEQVLGEDYFMANQSLDERLYRLTEYMVEGLNERTNMGARAYCNPEAFRYVRDEEISDY